MNVERLKKLVRGIVDADDMLEAMRILSDTGQTALERECNALAARVQMLEDVHKEDNAGIENLRAEVARWQAIATRAVEALRKTTDALAEAGRGAMNYSPPLSNARAVIADFDAAGTTTALDTLRDAFAESLANEITADRERVVQEATRARDELWVKAMHPTHGVTSPLPPEAITRDIAEFSREAREAAREEAAKLIEPKEPRPESPDLSAYTNHDDAAFDWASHELTVAAAKIRALAKKAAP